MVLRVYVSCTLSLEVFLVVACEIVLPCCWLTARHPRHVVSKPLVYQSLLLHLVDRHISHRIVVFALQLASDALPVGFDALHVPLVDHSHYILGLQAVQFSKDTLVSLIDQYFLLLRDDFRQKTDQKVDSAAIN